MDPAIILLAKASLTLLFGAAALHKLRHAQDFAHVTTAYQLMSERFSTVIARLLPILELAVAVGIWAAPTRVPASLLGAALLVIYAAAIGINLARGRDDIDCGCTLSTSGRSRIGSWMLARNAILAVLALIVAAPATPRLLTPIDLLTVVGGVCVLALLYMAIDGLNRLELQS